jgi:hypothetical protein
MAEYICERCRKGAGVCFVDCYWMCLKCVAGYLDALDAEARRPPDARRRWRVIGADRVESYWP